MADITLDPSADRIGVWNADQDRIDESLIDDVVGSVGDSRYVLKVGDTSSGDQSGGGNDLIDWGMLRLTGAGSATLASVNHAFQIGASTGLNLASDTNTIQARNNGATASLGIQQFGGTTTFGGNVIVSNTGTATLTIRDSDSAGNAASARFVFEGSDLADIGEFGLLSTANQSFIARCRTDSFRIQPNFNADSDTYETEFSSGVVNLNDNFLLNRLWISTDIPTTGLTDGQWAVVNSGLSTRRLVTWDGTNWRFDDQTIFV